MEVDLPAWYFQKDEKLEILKQEIGQAVERLNSQEERLSAVIDAASNRDFIEVEKNLHASQVVFNTAVLPFCVSLFTLMFIVFLNIVFEMFIVPLVDCCSCFRRFIILIKLSFAEHNILVSVINLFIMFNVLLNARITVLILGL